MVNLQQLQLVTFVTSSVKKIEPALKKIKIFSTDSSCADGFPHTAQFSR